MASFTEYKFMDATSLAELVRKKELKPIELIEAAIERVEQLNPKFNAVITPMFEKAIKEAKGNIPQGPFTGVPILLKDIAAEHAGVRHTEASDFLGDYIAPNSSELVLKKRSFIPVIQPEIPIYHT